MHLRAHIRARAQIYEARVHGADTCLLIVTILADDTLCDLIATARSLGMEPLVEVASAAEMRRAVACGARVVGINNRNLKTFTVDPQTTERVIAEAGIDVSDILVIALSGGWMKRFSARRYPPVTLSCHLSTPP